MMNQSTVSVRAVAGKANFYSKTHQKIIGDALSGDELRTIANLLGCIYQVLKQIINHRISS